MLVRQSRQQHEARRLAGLNGDQQLLVGVLERFGMPGPATGDY